MNKPMREGFVSDEPVEEVAPPPKTIEAVPEEQPPADPVALPQAWPMVIPLLHKPIQKSKNGPEITELSFREPTARDIMNAGGNPCRIEVTMIQDGQVILNPIIDDAKMIRVMANLTGILSPILQSMDPRDYNSCAHRLRRYFLPEQGVW
jgi:Phage tail assembly chaperone proteins, E, or 41 or 14